MKIGINARVLLKGRMEGVCRYIHETTKRMVLAHPEDEFVFFFDRPFHPSFIYANNVTPVVLPPPARDPILWKIWFEYVLPRALKKHQVDCLISGDTYASTKTDIPTLLISHDIAFVHYPEHIPRRVLNYYRKYFPKFHRNASHIISVSNATKSDLIKSFNIEPERISIAYNAVPDGFEKSSETDKKYIRNQFTEGNPFFIYVGSIHPRKNVSGLIRGFEVFKKKGNNHKLILLGRKAWKYDEIEQQIIQSNYARDIIFLDGHIHDPRKILPAADALCYISHLEGFGIPIIEAMQCEVPVICSDVSSMPEVGGDAALLVTPTNPEEIAQALFKVISDDSLAKEMVKKGKDQIKKFDWKTSSEIIYQQAKLIANSYKEI